MSTLLPEPKPLERQSASAAAAIGRAVRRDLHNARGRRRRVCPAAPQAHGRASTALRRRPWRHSIVLPRALTCSSILALESPSQRLERIEKSRTRNAGACCGAEACGSDRACGGGSWATAEAAGRAHSRAERHAHRGAAAFRAGRIRCIPIPVMAIRVELRGNRASVGNPWSSCGYPGGENEVTAWLKTDRSPRRFPRPARLRRASVPRSRAAPR